jgi:hypothetical protein
MAGSMFARDIQGKTEHPLLVAVPSMLARLTTGVSVSLEKHFWRWATLLLISLLACFIARDLHLKMWTDELFTLFIAKQSSFAGIVRAIAAGSDGEPPLYAMIAHSILPVVQSDALAIRLPSTLGFCGMLLGLLAFCRRRLPASYAFFAALIAGRACLSYATEGRAYGLLLGCAAGALLSWQMAAEDRRRGFAIPLLALCLAVMVALHYYAVFFFVPLFAGEIVRSRTTGKLDFAVLSAMAPAVLVLGLHYPLIEASKPFQEHFWSPASLSSIQPYYVRSLAPFLPALSLAVIAMAVLPNAPMLKGSYRVKFPLHELIATGGLALMPAMAIVMSTYITHAFVDRYVVWAVLGIALLATVALFRAVGGRAAISTTLLVSVIFAIAKEEIPPLFKTAALRESEAMYRQLEVLPAGPEIIAVADSHIFLELSYYAEKPLRQRLVYPLSHDLDLQYTGYDTAPLLLSALRQRAPINVKDYAEVLAEHRRFVLAATAQDYLPWHLAASGYRVVPMRPAGMLYEVSAPAKSGAE